MKTMKRLLTTLTSLVLCICSVEAQDADHHRLTNLPHVYIDTYDGHDVTSKSVEVWARMWYVDEEDVVTYYDSIAIRGRGNST